MTQSASASGILLSDWLFYGRTWQMTNRVEMSKQIVNESASESGCKRKQ